MIRPFAPFTPRRRAAPAVKVSHGRAPHAAELPHDRVDSKTKRSMLRRTGPNGAASVKVLALKVLGRKPQTVVLGKRGC